MEKKGTALRNRRKLNEMVIHRKWFIKFIKSFKKKNTPIKLYSNNRERVGFNRVLVVVIVY